MNKLEKTIMKIAKELVHLKFEGDFTEIGQAIGFAISETVEDEEYLNNDGCTLKNLINGIDQGLAKANDTNIQEFYPKKEVIDLLQWSKQAEWIDGVTKRAYIDNDWAKYIKLFQDNKIKKA